MSENKVGKVEYKVDKSGIVHASVAKASFDAAEDPRQRMALIEAVLRAKPASAKGIYMKKISLSTTMGPGLRIDPSSVESAAALRRRRC